MWREASREGVDLGFALQPPFLDTRIILQPSFIVSLFIWCALRRKASVFSFLGTSAVLEETTHAAPCTHFLSDYGLPTLQASHGILTL